VSLGAHVPVWQRLADQLRQLAEHTGAAHAVVADAFNDLWCRDSALGEDGTGTAFALLDRALRSASRPPERGGRIDLVRASEPPYLIARSFAGVYVLILWFDAPFEPDWARGHVHHMLPDIERLTVALPPPDGPESGANAARRPRG
jgi:hypothetical protein